jgi:DNA-binding transcriptional ArsR family regulator
VITAIERYIKDNLDMDAKVEPCPDISIFPLFLKNSFRFYTMTLLDVSCILLDPIQELPPTSELQKQVSMVKTVVGREVVVLLKGITPYKRRSLIGKRIPFIVEGNQIFLPFLGMHLSKAYIENKAKPKSFTLSAQLTFLYFLYGKIEEINATQLALLLKMTLMSASRALNELYGADLLSYEVGGKTGKSKVYRKIQDPLFFERGKDFLQTPVQKVVFVRKVPPNALGSGLEALAQLSRLNPPRQRVLAVGNNYLSPLLKNVHYFAENVFDEMGIMLEIWKYPPELFSCREQVDLASLYACLKDQKDERIEQALEEALRGESWYTG